MIKKTYYKSSEQRWFDHHKVSHPDLVDEVFMVLEHENSFAEVKVEWIKLGQYGVASKFSCFDDTWWTLDYLSDVFKFLAGAGKSLELDQLCKFLESVGYVKE